MKHSQKCIGKSFLRLLGPPGISLLNNVNRLRICHTSLVSYRPDHAYHKLSWATVSSLDPLERLVLHHCDMGAYLVSFHDHPELRDVRQLVVLPPIKELTISHPSYASHVYFEVAMVGIVESQHELGVPFERGTVRMDRLPAEMAEKLRPWVGVVHCYNQVEPA